MSDNIKVVVKVRPLIARELEEKLSYQWSIHDNTIYQVDKNGKQLGTNFAFDTVFDDKTKSEDVYKKVAQPIVEATIAGFNGTIFAYGQTSSGKTYTMTGTDESPGLIPLSVINLFNIIRSVPNRDFLVRCSYIEIYNEKVKDLLDVEKTNIRVFENTTGGVVVEVTEKMATSPEEVLNLMKKGEQNRQIGATNMNEESSRSHSIFQIIIESRKHVEGDDQGSGCVNISHLNLVDLAGSERSGQTGATGLRFIEGTHINKSLSTLAMVINQLSEDPSKQTKHISYRDSKLTRILQNSLGGNAKTSIICAVTPAAVEETISTLQFANRAKAIRNKPKVNEVISDASMIQKLTKQMTSLLSELERKKNIEQANHQLSNKIQALQKLILNGFEQRNLAEQIANRRKTWCAPRRMTISTLHPIDEDPMMPSIPKFCTPGLKYNPRNTPGSLDFFTPIEKTSKLKRVSEEASGQKTPPLQQELTVQLNDEVIEIDSDDDDKTISPRACSPYHTCKDTSKTPPCILRKTAKQAQKDLNDIVKLTEREKMYAPNVVEMMEKCEQQSTKITQLEEEISVITAQCQDKDAEVKTLHEKLVKFEEDLKTSAEENVNLLKKHNDYHVKLVDMEVSYETLKNKSESREKELLSLLNDKDKEKTIKHPIRDNDQLLAQNNKAYLDFMDLSKEISLVNSDIDCSIANTNVEETTDKQTQNLVLDIQNQLSSKIQMISYLESEINENKTKMDDLEILKSELKVSIENLSEKNDLLVAENAILYTTIDTLNEDLKLNKNNLKFATMAVEESNGLVSELQNKLKEKDNLLKIDIDDDLIETMISNEKKLIASNDNLKNIIHAFKLALDKRNKDIESLKFNLNERSLLQQKIDSQEMHTSDLNEHNIDLQQQLKNKTESMNTLLLENERLMAVNKDSIRKLVVVQNNLSEFEESFLLKITIMTKKIEELINKNSTLVNHLIDKNACIEINKKTILQHHNDLKTLKVKCREILSIIPNCDFNNTDTENTIDDIYNTLNTFELNIINITEEKQALLEENTNCQRLLSELNLKIEHHVKVHKSHIVLQEGIEKDKTELKNEVSLLSKKLENSRNRISDTAKKYNLMEQEINNLKNEISRCNNELMSQTYSLSKEKEEELERIKSFNHLIENNLKIKQKEADDIIKQLHQTEYSLKNSNETHNINLTKIYNHIFNILNMDEQPELVFDKDASLYDKCIKSLVYLCSKISTLKNESTKISEHQTLCFEINKQLLQLQKENEKHVENLTKQEEINLTLRREVDAYQSENKTLNADLVQCDYLVKQLQEEIKNKNIIFDEIELKLKCHIQEVTSLNNSLKEQIGKLELENYSLKNAVTLSSSNEPENKMLKMSSSTILINDDISVQNPTEQPKKLFTLCYNIVLDILSSNESDPVTDLLTKSDSETINPSNNELSSSILDNCLLESNRLKETFNKLELINKQRLANHEKSLLDSNTESLNSISIPRTNLCYTENKLLRSQLKVLQHYHKRCHNVCQKDVPTIKIQLQNLLSILKDDSNCSILDIDNASYKRYSLPDVLDKNSSMKNESTLDGDMLMMDTNETVVTDNTIVGTSLNLSYYPDHFTSQQNIDFNQTLEHNQAYSQIESLSKENKELYEMLEKLKDENRDLGETIGNLKPCNDCQNKDAILFKYHELLEEKLSLHKELSTLKSTLAVITENRHESKNNTDKAEYIKNSLSGSGWKKIEDLTFLNDDVDQYDNNQALRLVELSPQQDAQTEKSILNITKSDLCSKNLMFSKYQELLNNITKIRAVLIEIKSQKLDLQRKFENITEVKKEIVSKLNSNFFNKVVTSEDSGYKDELLLKQSELSNEVAKLKTELNHIKAQKQELKEKYDDLCLEIPSIDNLVKNINSLNNECSSKSEEIAKLLDSHKNLKAELKQYQDENETLSTQVMENISETDDLRKELKDLKESNNHLQAQINTYNFNYNTDKFDTKMCPDCVSKDNIISSLKSKYSNVPNLNRRHSEAGPSVKYNKIFTLQNELHASTAECKELTEDVATIKNHLDRSNLSITQNLDLEEVINETNVSLFCKETSLLLNKNECLTNSILEKEECLKYYLQITETEKENIDFDIRTIDLMKKLYNTITTKHVNELENFINKLSDLEDDKKNLSKRLIDIESKHDILLKELENDYVPRNKINQVANNIKVIKDMLNSTNNIQAVDMFKIDVLKLIDNNFEINSVTTFDSLVENIIKKHNSELEVIKNQYSELQIQMKTTVAELSKVNFEFINVKAQLDKKEEELNLLEDKKQKNYEICSAVTLDIIGKEMKILEKLRNGCEMLVSHNILKDLEGIDFKNPVNLTIDQIFQNLVYNYKKSVEDERSILSTKNSETEKSLNLQEQEISKLRMQLRDLDNFAENFNYSDWSNNDSAVGDDVKSKLLKIIVGLVHTVDEKKKKICELNINQSCKEQEFTSEIETMKMELVDLKTLNTAAIEENKKYSLELSDAKESIVKYKQEIETSTSDLLKLRESIKVTEAHVEKYKLEAKKLLEDNNRLQQDYELKCVDYSKLQENIKTIESAARFQNNMISRLEKEKSENIQTIILKDKEIQDLQTIQTVLVGENQSMKNIIKDKNDSLKDLNLLKEQLESRLRQLHTDSSSKTFDPMVENSRRRRQTLNESKKFFADDEKDIDSSKVEAMFASRSKPDDLFMDVDDAGSNKSTPKRSSQGRDSFSLNEKEREHTGSRPSSVEAVRLRRQSTHDLHRTALRHTPSPHGVSKRLSDFENENKQHINISPLSLREKLTSCQRELQELKEKYQELDEECETCSQYLQQRDQQCVQLAKEKKHLEIEIKELKEKNNTEANVLKSTKSVTHVAVNTENVLDWGNLHSIVVDKMSFDAEVDKNKKLTKALEEFRFKNRDLKTTLAKMQVAMESKVASNSVLKEFEATKSELEELKQQYKELDQEYETCAEYLKEREEQCKTLKKLKDALEIKLKEKADGQMKNNIRNQDGSNDSASSAFNTADDINFDESSRPLTVDNQSDINRLTRMKLQSNSDHSRKKRQSFYDRNREASIDGAANNVTDDIKSYDVSSRPDDAQLEIARLTGVVEKLTQQKAALERIMNGPNAMPMYVATGSGIVQNQQLTDVMKENQKLKKINAKLINVCKKRSKPIENRENDEPLV